MTSKHADEQAVFRAAITRLALATREPLPVSQEDRNALFRIYWDGVNRFSIRTIVSACRRLETTSKWFPKVSELVETCAAIVARKRDEAKPTLALPSGDTPLDPEKLARFREDVARTIRAMRMR